MQRTQMRLVRAPTPRPRLSKATMRLEAVWRSSGLQIWKKIPKLAIAMLFIILFIKHTDSLHLNLIQMAMLRESPT